MAEESLKPNLFNSSNSLVLTYTSVEKPIGGTNFIMKNLLSYFNKNSFQVISCKPVGEQPPVLLFRNLFLLTNLYQFRRPVQKILKPVVLYLDTLKIQKLIDEQKPEYFLVIYPSNYNVELALKLNFSKSTKVIAYLHDTYIEGQSHKMDVSTLTENHNRFLKKINLMFVMSEGMQNLYKTKYKVDAISLEHSFPEYNTFLELNKNSRTKTDKNGVLWGGNILGYNSKSLKRIAEVFEEANIPIEIASRQEDGMIAKILGHIKYTKSFYSNRAEYINALNTKEFLILALDWPEDTEYHFDEISTIFSTKAIEYLLSDTPTIVHCPEEYFMASFFKKHNCGYVISSKDKQEIKNALKEIQGKDHSEILANAKKASVLFSPQSIITKINQSISTINN